MKHLDLCSGIGGFALAARINGIETVAFAEPDPKCCAVLEKNFPGIINYGELQNIAVNPADYARCECCDNYWCERHEAHLGECPCVTEGMWGAEGETDWPDIVTAGWPCQPFSVSGKRRGKKDDRHLWPEVLRILETLRPTWFLGENVPGIVSMELDTVLSDLEGIGYSTQAFDIPASGVGAIHRRHRIWVVAHSNEKRGCGWQSERGHAVDAVQPSMDSGEWRLSLPGVDRACHGIPRRLDRIGMIGNAIVPQIAARFFAWMKAADAIYGKGSEIPS
jgi:DNA (cytosine-5)-methyltransferase 1